MEKALEENKTLKKLTLIGDNETSSLPREFCCYVLLGSRQNTSLLELNLSLVSESWYCPRSNHRNFAKYGRLVYVRHMLCDSVGCSV